ncbi:aminophospholipid translocase [Cystobasidiomycetes sp. EMM_F5]
MLDRYPEQYQYGQMNAFIIYLCGVAIFYDELILPQGWLAGQWIWGTTVYMATLVMVLAKAAMISDLWTKYTVAAIPGSLAFAFVSLPLYQWIAPKVGVSTEYQLIVPRLWSNGIFYFTIILMPVLCLSRDFAWKSYKHFARPEPYHIIQEIQKLNLPDYRPRKTQFSQAIKKIRALQRTRRNRGFAFSQTEESQERIIRSYDTTVPKAKG